MTPREQVEEAILQSNRQISPGDLLSWPDDHVKSLIGMSDGLRHALKSFGPACQDLDWVRAHARLSDRVRMLHTEMQRRTYMRKSHTIPAASVSRDVEEAREATRRIAAEFEALQLKHTELEKLVGRARFLQAFYETCKFVLAESTWKRLEQKARELSR